MTPQRETQAKHTAITAYMICRQSGETVDYLHRDGASGFSGTGISGFSGFSGFASFPAVQSDYQKTETTGKKGETELTTVTWTIPTCTPPLHYTNFPPDDSNEPSIGDYVIHDGHKYRVMACSTDPLKAAWVIECEREQPRRTR